MELFIVAVAVLLGSGVAALLAGRGRMANALGPAGAVIGSIAGFTSAIAGLVRPDQGPASLTLDWSMPMGHFVLGLDGLSCVFLLPVFVLAAAAAVYGHGSMARYAGRKALGAHWLFFNLTAASLALAIAARDGMLFLICWEIMSLAPFFLISFHHEQDTVRSAAWVYLVAAHLGGAFLLAFFAILGRYCGGLEFALFEAWRLPAGVPAALFLLALAGFGAKAGIVPLHVWMPEAYPAAPSHIPAFMSGALSKIGIYGILRSLTFLGTPDPWWPYLLIGLGLASGILGILLGLSQRNVKKLLAYSSIENIGIIVLGLGLGLLGTSLGRPLIATLGFGGAILHVVNHSLFKGLLFLCAGSVLHATGTVIMERLGGLMKRMPLTGACFLVGAAAICGLPPLNGFSGEILLYVDMALVGVREAGAPAVAAWAGLAGLAFIGGLAALGLLKALGIAFLGEPRSNEASQAVESASAGERWSVAVLAAACVMAGLLSPLLFALIRPAVEVLLSQAGSLPTLADEADLTAAVGILRSVVMASAPLILGIGILIVIRARLLAQRPVGASVTWDCGYAAPSTRMQYTGSSFSQPMTRLMRPLLGNQARLSPPEGLFPARATLVTATPDWIKEKVYTPAMEAVVWASNGLKWLQHGHVSLYILYIVVTLIGVLAWRLV